MKSRTIYQCEYCLSEYETSKEAHKCEADCLKLTLDEYIEYLDLLVREKTTAYLVGRTKNETTEKLFDDAIKDVIEFQKKHGITDSRWQ